MSGMTSFSEPSMPSEPQKHSKQCQTLRPQLSRCGPFSANQWHEGYTLYSLPCSAHHNFKLDSYSANCNYSAKRWT
eukprot:5525769-Amphidinium_carterae.1